MNIELLIKILKMDELSLLSFIKNYVREKKVISDNENYVYIKNKSPLVLVAHMDTVRHSYSYGIDLEKKDNIIRNKLGILGGDDRAGVFMLLRIYDYCKKSGGKLPQLLFTNYEESGGIGVSKFIKDKHLNTNKVKFFIEADRRGHTEYVTYNKLPIELQNFMEAYGYNKTWGSYSDIYNLTSSYNIPSVNIAAGYYHQHTPYEFINVDHLMDSLGNLKNIVNDMYKLPNYDRNADYRGSSWDDMFPNYLNMLDLDNAEYYFDDYTDDLYPEEIIVDEEDDLWKLTPEGYCKKVTKNGKGGI